MNPNDLRDEVESHVRGVIDFEKWDHHERIEEVEFESLSVFAKSLQDAAHCEVPHETRGARA